MQIPHILGTCLDFYLQVDTMEYNMHFLLSVQNNEQPKAKEVSYCKLILIFYTTLHVLWWEVEVTPDGLF